MQKKRNQTIYDYYIFVRIFMMKSKILSQFLSFREIF